MKIFFQKLNQNNKNDIYIGKMNIKNLYKIHRVSFLKEEDFNDLDTEGKIEKAINTHFDAKQREDSPKRIISISKYIDSDLGIFPNAIILGNIKGKSGVNFIKDKLSGFFELNINIEDEDEKLFVIDGQHRLKGIALNYYIDILLKIKKYFINDKDKINEIIKIEKISNPIDKIDKVKLLYAKYRKTNLDNIINQIELYELPVVIIDNISNSKIIEIFTDINGLVVPLTSNHIRFNYGFFTNKQPPKFDLLNISVNLGKLLNDNKFSPLYGLVKMPYKFSYYEDNIKGYSQVSLSAFCQRFEERGKIDIKKINSNIKNYNFYNKTLGIFIYHRFLNGEINQKLPINEKSIIETINFLFLIFSYSYLQMKNTFNSLVDIELKKDDENKNFRFISSTSNELYFYIIDYILTLIVSNSKYNIDSLFHLEKNEIKDIVNHNFKVLKKSLIDTYKENSLFLKGTQVGTGQSASSRIIKYFNKQLENNTEICKQEFIDEFNLKVEEYYIKKEIKDKEKEYNELIKKKLN